jgi:hypothetical protein
MIKSMGAPGKRSRRAKHDVRQALDLHRQLNPGARGPVIVALDAGTGQLFLTARRGLCWDRDRANEASVQAKLYEACAKLGDVIVRG